MADWIRWLTPPAIIFAGTGSCLAIQYLSVDDAQKLMFPGIQVFERTPLSLTLEQARAVERRTGVRERAREVRLWRVLQDGKLAGYFVLDEVVGKHEVINYAIALSPQGVVQQVEVLDYREAYGYEIRNPAWRKQFVGRTSADPLQFDEDIRNISGATLSCRHVTEGVKRVLGLFDVAINRAK
jgi:Na+-translocating ferredoxin:NAD+ oxidoreductase RnfG subunit